MYIILYSTLSQILAFYQQHMPVYWLQGMVVVNLWSVSI